MSNTHGEWLDRIRGRKMAEQRLIDANALIEDLEYDVELDSRMFDDMDFVGDEREHVQDDKDSKQYVIQILQNAPTIEERKRGKWYMENHTWFCDRCGKNPTRGMGYVQGRDELFNFCPNCGADMRGEEHG